MASLQIPSPPRSPAPLGRPTLRLLAKPAVVALVLELGAVARSEADLERRLPALSRRVLASTLEQLRRSDAVLKQDEGGLTRRYGYRLSNHGQQLLALARHAARWEAETRIEARTLPGAVALRTLADEDSLQALVDLGRGSPAQRLPARTWRHAARTRTLARLALDGLLVRRRGAPQFEPSYEPSPAARLLGAIAIHAMASERGRLATSPTPPSDICGLLGLLAPAVSAPPDLRGAFLLIASDSSEQHPRLALRVDAGAIQPVSEASLPRADGSAEAPLQTWLQAISHCPDPAIDVSGDRTSLASLLHLLGWHLRH